MKRYMGSKLLKKCGSRWVDIDILNYTLSKLLYDFREIYITILDGADEKIINIKSVSHSFLSHNETIKLFINRMNYDGLTVAYADRIPLETRGAVEYSNAYQAGYKITTVDTRMNTLSCGRRFKDLIVYSPLEQVSTKAAVENCLFTVNGMFFRHAQDDTKVRIPDAGLSVSGGRRSHIGIVSFYRLGGLNISAPRLLDIPGLNGGPKADADVMLLSIDYSPSQSTVLVFGGYLVFPKADVFWRVSDTVMAFRPIGIPHMERMLNLMDSLDTSHLDIDPIMPQAQSCRRDYYYSAEFLNRLMSSSNSFVVSINSPIVGVSTASIRSHRYPGLIVLDRKPVKPLISAPGRIIEYWRQPVDGYWHLGAKDTHYRDFVMESDLIVSDSIVKDRLKSRLVHARSNVGFLEIIGYY